MGYLLTEGHFTDKGLVRRENEDSLFHYIGDSLSIFCVADGMGGHSNGERASTAVVEGVQEWLGSYYPEKYMGGLQDILDDLEKCLQKANQRIYKYYNNSGQVCGSTVVILLIYNKYYAALSLGDSRIYKRNGFSFTQLTRDDTWQNTESAKRLFEGDGIRGHKNYGKLVKAFGTQESVVFWRKTDKLRQGDSFLLCTDGVYKYGGIGAVRRCCGSAFWDRATPMDKLRELKDIVFQKGAPDNLTAILVRVGYWRPD